MIVDIDQALRNMFEHTIAEMDDPRTVDELDVVGLEAFGILSLDGSIKNMRTAGIHNIRLEHVQYNSASLECDVDVILPGLTFAATNYDLSGRFGGLIPIFGNGPFDVQTKGTSIIAPWT